MSTLKVDQLEAATASTITVPSGQTLDISSATLTPPAAMPASSGVNLTALNATQLTSGTIPDDARLPTVGIDKGGTGTTTGLILLKHQLFTNGTRTAISAAAQDLWIVSFTKLQTSSTLVVKATMQGHTGSSGCTTEYIQIGGTKYRSISFRYCSSWDDANFQMQGTAEQAGDTAGAVSIRVGWDNGGKAFEVWNPNSTDESRNPQLVSTIEVMEIA